MNESDFRNFVDKLEFQVKSFQENFAFLSRSGSVEELARNFAQLLKGNFFLSDINILYLQKDSGQWVPFKVNNPQCLQYISGVQNTGSIHIDFPESGDFRITAIITLVDHSQIALLCGEKINKSSFTEPEKITLQMFFHLLDSAYQSFLYLKKEKQLLFSLNHRLLQLNTLIDTGIEISRLQNIDSLLHLALERAVSLTNASYGSLEAISAQGKRTKLCFPEEATERLFTAENTISTSVQFNGTEYILTLSEKESRDRSANFDETDKTLLTAFARQVLTAIENESLHREALEGERMHKEIEMAAAIQKRIIPQTLPAISGYHLAGINIPSLEIGGDYYDVVKLSNGNYVFIIADVAGKGVPSGLLVNTLNASINAYFENEFELHDIAKRLNKVIYKASPPDKFITAFIGILNPASSELEYVNAGHNPTYLGRENQLIKLDKGGICFGMLDMDLPYETETVTLYSGNRILFYTDGITEAMNEMEEEYSDQKLEEFFLLNNSSGADAFLLQLAESMKDHTQNTPQSDDITALYLIKE